MFSQGEDSGVYYEYTGAGQTSVCAYKSIILHEAPGRNSRKMGTIVFTEEMEHLGQEALLKEERRNYILVKTRDGKEGWVDEMFIVKDGGVVVLLEDSRVFERPATYSSSTSDYFRAGEIAILTDFQDNWVRVVSYRKEVNGWIEGYDKLSAEDYDIEIAAMLAKALEIPDPSVRRQELAKIGSMRGFTSSEMAGIVNRTLNIIDEANHRPLPTDSEIYVDQPNQGAGPIEGEDAFAITSPYRNDRFDGLNPDNQRINPVYVPDNKPRVQEREVVDMTTGRTYLQVTETGTIQPVKAKKPKSIYYCYHKTLPVGSKVLLEIPGQQGYVPLEVVAKLRADNPHVVGLGSEVIKAVFGVVKAKEVASVSISYPKR
ncbi:MAG: SH3 domain-containing protein [Bacteroidota bacterium]